MESTTNPEQVNISKSMDLVQASDLKDPKSDTFLVKCSICKSNCPDYTKIIYKSPKPITQEQKDKARKSKTRPEPDFETKIYIACSSDCYDLIIQSDDLFCCKCNNLADEKFIIPELNNINEKSVTCSIACFNSLAVSKGYRFCGGCNKQLNNLSSGCSRCKKTYYCNRECQLDHWKVHKNYCVAEIPKTAETTN